MAGSTVDPIGEAMARLHAAGLDARYDDVLEWAWASEQDQAEMVKGHHFDYERQVWVEGHDHAHIVSNDDSAPLLFCGASLASCCPEMGK